jgi:hypothetical protein
MIAQELRIGNYIGIGDGMTKVVAIRQGMVESENAHIYHKDLKPIPLTPDILTKCGFENDTEDIKTGYDRDNGYEFYKLPTTTFIISERDGEFRKYWEVDEDTFYSWHGVEIKYLHQLQNLFFALTGEELKINFGD